MQALLALIVALALQIAVNYSNDYSDGIRGTDDVRVGPIRLTASGLASAKAVKRAAFISFAVACVAGLALAATSSWWILIVGVISVLAAWGYTGGHAPYGYLGFGELSVFTFFGVVATVGTYYVQTMEFSAAAFAASVSMGSLSCALLGINNIRDRAQDAQVGKKTLAVRLGDENSRRFFIALLALPYIFAPLTGNPLAFLTLASAPPAIVITAEYDPLRDEGEQYGHALIANGVEASIVRYFGMFHGFFSLFPWLDDGKAAVSQVSISIRAARPPPSTK